ncbi:MAG: hypothetical protein ACNS60_12345, partial [Candidatus Cyclobacteriaceae bacterium M2_1C_046]
YSLGVSINVCQRRTEFQIKVDRQIEIKSNIKAIGWTSTVVFTLVIMVLLIYWLKLNLTLKLNPINIAVNDPNMQEFNNILSLTNFLLFFSSCFSLIFIITSKELVKLKNWALTGFHVCSAILIIIIIAAIIYYITSLNFEGVNYYKRFGEESANFQRIMLKYNAIAFSTFGLITAWILTRANLLLMKKDYRNEFKYRK